MSAPHFQLIQPPAPETEAQGQHALFAARVQHWPFEALARSVWEDLEHPAQAQLLERQLRFVAALHPGHDRLQPGLRLTLELRHVHRPESAEIDCVLIGKAFGADAQTAEAAARAWWETISGLTPLGYALAPAQTPADFDAWVGKDLLTRLDASEVRRPAEFLLWSDEKLPPRHLPVVQPFAWQASGWETIWAAQARADAPSLVSVSLRPAEFPVADEVAVAEMAHHLHGVAAEARPPLSTRAAEAASIYERYLRHKRGLYSVRVTAAGPLAVQQAVRGALSGPAWSGGEATVSGGAEIVAPASSEERLSLLTNLVLLEHEVWGRPVLPFPLERLRFVCDPAQALGAFRLPLLPPAGLPGVSVGMNLVS